MRAGVLMVGAGIDRTIHAYYVDYLIPLQLVARAKVAPSTVGTAGGPTFTQLLG